MNRQSGFTLIELVMVIVILGILAAAALPKFIDTTGEARQAAVEGIAGSLASSSVINYSASLAKGQVVGKTFADATATTDIVDTTGGCTETVAGNLVDGVTFHASNAGTYKLTQGSETYTNIGNTRTCTVTSNDDTTAAATFILTATE